MNQKVPGCLPNLTLWLIAIHAGKSNGPRHETDERKVAPVFELFEEVL
jgi:hypothetical protein